MLYEPAWPRVVSKGALAQLEQFAQAGEWQEFAISFFRDRLLVPADELEELRTTELWPPIIADAPPTLGDLRALSSYQFNAEAFRGLRMPVMLQISTQSPRELYVTDALAAVLADVRIEALPGQAHEAMTTAPRMYAEAVSRFLLG